MLDQVMVGIPFIELKKADAAMIKHFDLLDKLYKTFEVDDTALDKFGDADEEDVIVKVNMPALAEVLKELAVEKNELNWMLNPELMKVDWGEVKHEINTEVSRG